jgi:hypothetical protein
MRLLLAIALVACAHRDVKPVNVILVPCDQRVARPAIACASGRLGYDGCRWSCTLEPTEMEPMSVWIKVGGYEAKE